MSLHYLGIAHFPVLHRQFSSPTSQSFPESPANQDIMQDNKDVLLERLSDLVSRISRNNFLENSTVTAIHSEVDRIEMVMRGKEKPLEDHNVEGTQPKGSEEDTFWRPMTPTRHVKMRMSDTTSNSSYSPLHPPIQMRCYQAVEIAKAAEDLSSTLAAAVSELQTRKEESDHLHDLLITRSEKAAEKILLLEYRISEMEDDFEANQSELRFLRIQLQAIEAQCSQYVPPNEDSELTQSIMNWKVDWQDIDRRSKSRRKESRMSVSSLDGSHKGVAGS